MKIWIFDVSPGWDYCGGAIVVIAESLGNAINLLLDYKDSDGDECLKGHSFYSSVEVIPKLEKRYYTHELTEFFYTKDEGWDEWVLKDSFDVNETKEQVVLVSYNYA